MLSAKIVTLTSVVIRMAQINFVTQVKYAISIINAIDINPKPYLLYLFP